MDADVYGDLKGIRSSGIGLQVIASHLKRILETRLWSPPRDRHILNG